MPHQHDQTVKSISTGRLFFTMALNFLITVVQFIGGILSGSLALISDALHNFTDGIAIIISYIAVRLNQHPHTLQNTFGMKRAEILAAVINSAMLIAICFYLFKESYERFIQPEPIAAGMMIVIAVIGLIANIVGTLLLRADAKTNMNIRSAYLHLFSDTISSVAVIMGGVAIYFFDIYWVDPLITVLISLYILKESWSIVKEATRVLMMGTPENLSLEAIQREIQSIPKVNNLHHAHLWMLNEDNIHFEAHVDVEDMLVSESTQLCKTIEERLHQMFNIQHITLQFESNKCHSLGLV